jgi:hypothetical protein
MVRGVLGLEGASLRPGCGLDQMGVERRASKVFNQLKTQEPRLGDLSLAGTVQGLEGHRVN